MKMRKLVSGAMATVMAMSLAVPAFAASSTPAPTPVKILPESSEASFEVELEGSIYVPTIRVQVTQSGNVYVNPSQSLVEGKLTKALDGTTDLEYSLAGDSTNNVSLVSTPILIRNDTDKALTVSAKATATVPTGSDITLVGSKPGTTVTDKQAYIYVSGNGTSLGNSNEVKASKVTLNNCLESSPSTECKLVPASGGKSATNAGDVVSNIDAATHGTPDSTGKVTTVTPEYGAVIVAGSVTSPSKVTEAWAETDVVNVTVALTFGLA